MAREQVQSRSMNRIIFTLLVSLIGFSQKPATPTSPGLREVRGQTIISKELPAAELTFAKEFHYVGGQVVNLYNMAEAEQHFFVKAESSGVIERFYWVQFEHRLPADQHRYNYPADRTTDIGGLSFIYDVKSWGDYAAEMIEDPASDGAAISRLAGKHKLVFPKHAARVRMFHLPTADRRTELMIIYGEALPEGSPIPVRKEGVPLDKESPEAARALLENARRDLVIRKR
jgi:hypothetical protein